jgi:co-chaperonin GroES (HSP10)
MKIPSNYLLVEVESLMNDKIETESGVTLYRPLDIGDKQWFFKTKGKVRATPEKLSSYFTKCNINKKEMRTHKDMHLLYEVGDEVHFNYLSLNKLYQFIDPEDATKLLFLIIYDNIHYGIRDGQMIVNTGRCILKPLDEVQLRTTKLIIPPTFKKKSVHTAEVIGIGVPWKGTRTVELNPGDVVVYDKKEGDWVGRENEWLSVYHDHIQMILE